MEIAKSPDDFSKMLGKILRQCVELGMKLPFIVASISPNGSCLVVRMDGESPKTLAEHYEPGGFRLPMTIVVIKQDNQAVRISIEKDGCATWH
jgi:hypothetical protein